MSTSVSFQMLLFLNSPAATPLQDFTIEEITEERASKCLSRIDLLNKIRNEILPHPDIDERLTKCRPSMELPDWWQLGRHDKDLIIGVCRSVSVWPPIKSLSLSEKVVEDATCMISGSVFVSIGNR